MQQISRTPRGRLPGEETQETLGETMGRLRLPLVVEEEEDKVFGEVETTTRAVKALEGWTATDVKLHKYLHQCLFQFNNKTVYNLKNLK